MRTRLLPRMVLGPLACGTFVCGALACGGDKAGDDESAAATTSASSSGASSSGAGSSGAGSTGDSGGPVDPTTSATGGSGSASAEDSSGAPATTAPDDTGGTTGDDTGTPSACPDAPLPAGDHDLVIDHASGMRTAILHVPPGLDADTPAPLIFNFHGYTMTAAGEVTFSGMNTLADDEGILVVYPQGLDTSWNAGACCGNAQSQGVDDVGFVRALHAHLATQVCYDPRRVYSTGMSNGGFLSNRLACEAADIFAAVGPVSAVNGMDECDPSRPIPVIAFNGTNDLLVAYDGLLYQSVADSFSEWGARNGCEGAPVPGTMNGSASCETYDACAADVQVTQCTLEGMGHCCPATRRASTAPRTPTSTRTPRCGRSSSNSRCPDAPGLEVAGPGAKARPERVCRWFHAARRCCILRADPMAKAHLVPSRTLGVLLSATLVLACQSEQKKVTPTTASTAGANGAPTTPPPIQDAGTPGVAPAGTGAKVELASGGTIHALTAENDVLGHFLIANGSDLLRDIKTQLMIPKYAGFLEEAALRSVVSMALEQRGSMAQAFDLAAPMGCALVDPQQPEPKVSCTFGYRGGAKQFVTDIGDQNKQPDGAGHVAAYSVDNKSVYVDEVGGQVVVSSGKDTFGKTSAYLERNLIGRARDVHGDLELVVYVSTAFDRYRDLITPLLDQFSGMGAAAPPTTGNPAIDGAVQAFSAYQKRSSKQGFERIAEISQFTVFFSVEPAGVMIGGAAFPKPGSRAAQEAAQFGGLKLDSASAGVAPSGTALLAAFHTNPRFFETASVADMRKLLAEAWAPLSGRDAAGIEAALTAYQTENAALYDGQAMFALANEPGAPVALMVAAHLNAGQAARDSWKAWSQVFTPQNVLGANFSQYLSWKFTPDAATVEGVPVDRWTIEPGPAVGKQIESSMPADARAMVDKVLGGLYLHIDRAEVGGHVIHTVAPKSEANFMKRAIGAAQGKDNVGAQAGFSKVVQRDPEATGVMAVDVKQVLNLVRNTANYGAKPGELPNLGTDLADFYATFRYTADGTSAMEFVISQQIIDQIKAIVPK